LQETFKNEGLDYSMDGLTGNTLNSHRLIAYAGQQGLDVQDRLVEELFKAYFTQVRLLQLHLTECLHQATRCASLSWACGAAALAVTLWVSERGCV